MFIILFSVLYADKSDVYIKSQVYTVDINKIEYNTVFTDLDTTIALRVIDSIKTNDKHVIEWLINQEVSNMDVKEHLNVYTINLTQAKIPPRAGTESGSQEVFSLETFLSNGYDFTLRDLPHIFTRINAPKKRPKAESIADSTHQNQTSSDIYINSRIYSANISKIEHNTLFTDTDSTVSLRVIDSIRTHDKQIVEWLANQHIINITVDERAGDYYINLTQADIPLRIVPESTLRKTYSLQTYYSNYDYFGITIHSTFYHYGHRSIKNEIGLELKGCTKTQRHFLSEFPFNFLAGMYVGYGAEHTFKDGGRLSGSLKYTGEISAMFENKQLEFSEVNDYLYLEVNFVRPISKALSLLLETEMLLQNYKVNPINKKVFIMGIEYSL